MVLINIDASDRSFLVVCSCGYRDICSSRMIARAAAAMHEERAHPGVEQARRANRQLTRRHTDTIPGCTALIPPTPDDH